MAPRCSVFKDQAPENGATQKALPSAGAANATVDRRAEGSENEPVGPRSPKAPGLAAGTDRYQARRPAQPGTVRSAPRTHQGAVPAAPGQYQQAAAQERRRLQALRARPRPCASFTERPPPAASRTASEMLADEARALEQLGVGGQRRRRRRASRWARRRAPPRAPPGRRRRSGHGRTAPRTCASRARSASSPCTSAVSSRGQRAAARRARAAARRWPRSSASISSRERNENTRRNRPGVGIVLAAARTGRRRTRGVMAGSR